MCGKVTLLLHFPGDKCTFLKIIHSFRASFIYVGSFSYAPDGELATRDSFSSIPDGELATWDSVSSALYGKLAT